MTTPQGRYELTAAEKAVIRDDVLGWDWKPEPPLVPSPDEALADVYAAVARIAADRAAAAYADLAAAQAALQAVEEVLNDPANGWWHTGGTRCTPTQKIRAVLPAPPTAPETPEGTDELAWRRSAWAEARTALATVADRMDEHAYDELATVLDDDWQPVEPAPSHQDGSDQ